MPRIGLLSDSHGQAAITREAVALLLEHGAEMLVHLGDVGTEAVIDALAVAVPGDAGDTARQVPARLVFGNTDVDLDRLGRYAQDLGVSVDHPVGRLALPDRGDGDGSSGDSGGGEDAGAGGELVFCHGHETAPMRDAIARHARYLCHGHTHVATDARAGRTRVINPGALHRARQHTVAMLCTETDVVRFYPVVRR